MSTRKGAYLCLETELINQLAAASPALVITCGIVAAVAIICVTLVVATAVRAANPRDVPRIVTTVCRTIRPRRR